MNIVENLNEHLDNLIPALDINAKEENARLNDIDDGLDKTAKLSKKNKVDAAFSSRIDMLNDALKSDVDS